MDEIRMVAGPIAQRYFDKVEAEREEVRKQEEAELQRKKEMAEAARQAAIAMEAAENGEKADEVMTDADKVEPEVEEKWGVWWRVDWWMIQYEVWRGMWDDVKTNRIC